jgi:porin
MLGGARREGREGDDQRRRGRRTWGAQLAALCGAALLVGTAAAQDVGSVSGNPGATTYLPGTGQLGRWLGLRDEWGLRLGGVWLADLNLLAAGGVQPDSWTANSALIVGLNIDAEKLVNWRGAGFGFQFLQLNAADTNDQAGMIAGYNGIVGPKPRQRSEFYEAWYEQVVLKDVLKLRLGRSTPAVDFNNVMRPLTLRDDSQNIPAVSGVLYPTVFANGSLLGALPGYYNPGDGVTVNFTPTRTFYLNLGAYDGNLARGIQTGLTGPQLNGYYFMIGEIGFNWLLGEGRHPGQFGIGLWHETGQLTGPPGIVQDGTGGVYLFGSQRLAFGLNDRVKASSISAFYQFGVNDSQTLPINQYYGAGLTGFALIGDRAQDSMGLGVGVSRTNPNLFVRSTEIVLQAYYQAHLFATVFLQPTVSYVPTPGAVASAPGALATTVRLTVLF